MEGTMGKQKGFFDEDYRLAELEKHGDPLLKLNAMIPWERFRPLLKKIFFKQPKSPGGRPSYDYVMMFKILILQRLYNVSDSQMQFQIMDRLSFMRFLGLNLNDHVPDEKTIWHFREVLTKSGKIEILFEEFRTFLLDKGVIAESGTIVDASFVEAPKQRNTKEENKDIKEGKLLMIGLKTNYARKMLMLGGR
jgi:transposase, IS5 family